MEITVFGRCTGAALARSTTLFGGSIATKFARRWMYSSEVKPGVSSPLCIKWGCVAGVGWPTLTDTEENCLPRSTTHGTNRLVTTFAEASATRHSAIKRPRV
tara:strand:+ start:146 stop:451 length:306 start_codon:yes stop_codon:yes gene_type:complete